MVARMIRRIAGRKMLLVSGLQVVCLAGLIAYLVHAFGVAPFAAGIQAVNVWTVLAALSCGFVATWAQGARWRIICRGYGIELSTGQALRQCYGATLLNSVLPSGMAGDAHRTVQHRAEHKSSWSSSIGSVAGERLAGTVIVILAAAIALATQDWRLSIATLAVAVVVFAGAWPSIRRIALPASTAVWSLSLLQWGCFVLMFWAAASMTSPGIPFAHVAGLGAICLASIFIPLGVGGWGPREGATALAFMAYGYSGAEGVAAATGYGILALISVLPGLPILLASTSLAAQLRAAFRREAKDDVAGTKPI
ncbi:lysylphosphatidylglycerol synthase transmembrane domain-containing protein [Arthrobacter monumenti]